MKKSVFTLFLLTIFLFFSGCGKNVEAKSKDYVFETNSYRIVRKIDSENKILLSYIFPLNTDFMEKHFSKNQVDTYKFYMAVYVNALINLNKQKAKQGVKIGECLYFMDVDGIGFSILFDNVSAQNNFFVSEEKEEERKTETKRKTSGFLFQKTYLETSFPVSSKEDADNLKTVCVLAISSWSKECNISESDKQKVLDNLSEARFVYDFAVQTNQLQSEVMYDENGFHHNVFSKSINEIENDSKITFYVRQVNKGAVCLLTLIVVLVGVGVALFVVKIGEKKKK